MIKNFTLRQAQGDAEQSRSIKLGWKLVFLGLLILVLFFSLRLINLTILPVFADEAIYIRWSQVMRSEPTMRFLPLSDGKQPLFMWLMMPMFSLFSDPLFAGRIVSVLAGFGTLVGIFILGILLFRSKLLAIFACGLYAVVPFAVFFDRLALVDSLLVTFGVWALIAGILLAKYQRIDLAIFCGFILGGALLIKSPAMFFVLLLPLTAFLLDFKAKVWKVQLVKLVGLWLISYFLAFVIYNILRLGPNFEMIALRNKDYVFPLSELFSHPLDPFKPHIGQVWEWFQSFLGWPVILSFVVGVILGLKKFKREVILLVIWFLFPLLVQMAIAKVFTARYIFFTIPAFLLVASWGFFEISSRFKRSKLYILLNVFLVILIFLPYFYFNSLLITDPQRAPLPKDERRGYLEEWTSGYGIIEVKDYLQKLPRDKQIIVGTEGYFGTLPDGLLIYFDKEPKVTIIGVGLGLDQIPLQLADSAGKGNPTFLVANKSRIEAQKDPGLNLIMEIPKAKGDKIQDSLLFYQVK